MGFLWYYSNEAKPGSTDARVADTVLRPHVLGAETDDQLNTRSAPLTIPALNALYLDYCKRLPTDAEAFEWSGAPRSELIEFLRIQQVFVEAEQGRELSGCRP